MNTNINLEKINEVFFYVEADEEIYYELYSYFQVKVPGYNFSPKFKLKLWDGNISFFNLRQRTLPIGLFDLFQSFCKENDYTYSIKEPNFIDPSITDEYLESFYHKLFDGTSYFPRDYQKELIKVALYNKRGILLSSTGSGKSILLYTIIRYILETKRKIVLVVPNVSLVNQMYQDFYDYGWKDLDKYVTRLYSGQDTDFKKPVLITTFQSLVKRSSDFFEKFGAVIVDEAHYQKSNSLHQIGERLINADYRLGTTGTLEKKEQCDLYNIFGYLGPILKEYKTQELTDKKFLTEVKVRCLVINHNQKLIEESKNLDYTTEKKLLYLLPERNKVLNFIFSKIQDGENSLILVNEHDHLEFVKSHLEATLDKKYTLHIIHGKIKPEIREKIRKSIDSEKNVIILATYGTLSTGLNIKSIANIIFFSSSKGEIRVLQSIGRGVRLFKGKLKVVIWDIVDSLRYTTRNGNVVKNYLYKHWEGTSDYFGVKKGRLNFYQEQNFEYKILMKDLDTL